MAKTFAYAALAMDGKKIDANNKRIGTNSKALDQLIHATGVAIIIQSLPMDQGGHLDCSKAIRFVQALSAGQSRNRVVAWLHDFSNIRVAFSEETWTARLIKPGQNGYKDVDPIAADKTPFWDHTKEGNPIPKTMDDAALARRIAGLLHSIEQASEKGTLALTPATAAEVVKLRAMGDSIEKRAKGMAKQMSDALAKHPAGEKVSVEQLREEAGLTVVDPLTVAV